MAYGLSDIVQQRRMIDESTGAEAFKRVSIGKLDALVSLAGNRELPPQPAARLFRRDSGGGQMRQLRQLPVAAAGARRQGSRAKAVVLRLSHRVSAFGAMHLIDILIGRLTERVTQFGHDRLSVFGIGADLNEKQWRGVIPPAGGDGPSGAGLRGLRRIETDGNRARRLEGRNRGDAARADRRHPRPRRQGQIKRGDIAPEIGGPAEPPIRTWSARSRRGAPRWRAQRGVPAYVVLHDATIDGIATSRPTTLAGLRNIPASATRNSNITADELIALVQAAG
jgi:ATP-dependent DNA helicase RecQ